MRSSLKRQRGLFQYKECPAAGALNSQPQNPLDPRLSNGSISSKVSTSTSSHRSIEFSRVLITTDVVSTMAQPSEDLEDDWQVVESRQSKRRLVDMMDNLRISSPSPKQQVRQQQPAKKRPLIEVIRSEYF